MLNHRPRPYQPVHMNMPAEQYRRRPSRRIRMMSQAYLIAEGGTCLRRKSGCIIVDNNHHTMSTGYNGRPKDMPHCIDEPCAGVNEPSGQGLDGCEAVHGEQNALLQCPDVYRIHTIYTTTEPCIDCTRLILNTSCKFVIYCEPYPHEEARELWAKQSNAVKIQVSALRLLFPPQPHPGEKL